MSNAEGTKLLIAGIRDQIHVSLESVLEENDSNILHSAVRYVLQGRGKRVRAMLAMLAGQMHDAPYARQILAARAVEIFHAFTLVHDDIMDDAPVRRGKPSVVKKWNSNTAILSGDVMFALAVQHISDCNKEILPKVLSCFLETTIEVCKGQQMDMDFENRDDQTSRCNRKSKTQRKNTGSGA